MNSDLEKLAKLIRYYILLATTSAGSGHVTSSLSAVELMVTLFFKYLRFDLDDPKNLANDKLIFSKGHATPLFYSLFAAAGKLSEEDIKSYRNFDSVLEGHPSMRFPYTVAPTGSLGQGLSVGVGTALNDKYLDKFDTRTFVLLGDGEMAEGQVWEALQLASQYKLNNLVAILDVNRLGQTGETIVGHDIAAYESKLKSFGWRTYLLEDGHNFDEVYKGYEAALAWSREGEQPVAVIAKTTKGKGVSFLEDETGWHGKALSNEEFNKAVGELGKFDKNVRGKVKEPNGKRSGKLGVGSRKNAKENTIFNIQYTKYNLGDTVATRKAYGNGLVNLGKIYTDVVVLDGDVSNSTYSKDFAKAFPERFFEMFIAEQNMVSTALGLATQGKVPFVSTFAAFMTRAHDQIRMANISGEHIVFCGSHAGVSVGEDGPSQMGLDDMSMFRSLLNSKVFYPCDAVSTEKLLHEAYKTEGLAYIRTTRGSTTVIYEADEDFVGGGSKVLKSSGKDMVTVIAAGITVHEALKAQELLEKGGISIRVVDCYSVKPIDTETLAKCAKETNAIITVEDHYLEGGLGDVVLQSLATEKEVPVYKMGVSKLPRSGKPNELLEYEEISAAAIANKIKEIVS
jgi:transketolase